RLADMAASDLELGYAGAKVYAGFHEGAAFVVSLFSVSEPELVAVLEADHLGRLRTGAASAAAAKHLASEDAVSLGVIGCGRQAETQVACIRAALPAIERVVAYCRTQKSLREFCALVGAEAGESHRDPAEQDIVVTITTSRDPVLRGEWLRPGALVCACGANVLGARELDNVVLQRAAFVCCDSKEQAALESSDLVEPIELGTLDWLDVIDLEEVVAAERVHDLRAVEQASLLVDAQTVLHVAVLEDLRQPAAARVFAHDVGGDTILRARTGKEEGERASQQAGEARHQSDCILGL